MQDIDKIVKAQTRSTYLRELLSPDNVVDLESSYNRLSKEVTELKEELNTANMQLTAKTSQIQELQKQNHALASHPEKDRAIHDLHRQLSKMQKQIDAQQEQIECLTAQKQAVEEQNQMLLAVKRGEEEPIDIDPTKRYLFAVVEDAMKPKLKAWFPNCVLSQDASITQNNYNNIYMIILLTVDMTHKEGQWLKNKAISFNIPLVYCNSVSYRRICETIAAQEKLLGLR
jgi:myosin heavy subunit